MFPSGVKTTAPVDKNAQQLSKTRTIRTLSVKTHVQGDKKRAANNVFGQAPSPQPSPEQKEEQELEQETTTPTHKSFHQA